ncbi:unnamed protein product [Amoebophrya sp. A25]|nr:unnamed protein product [Amoebophrya sp. A25]|eukprot:GSA25T00014917001.1
MEKMQQPVLNFGQITGSNRIYSTWTYRGSQVKGYLSKCGRFVVLENGTQLGRNECNLVMNKAAGAAQNVFTTSSAMPAPSAAFGAVPQLGGGMNLGNAFAPPPGGLGNVQLQTPIEVEVNGVWYSSVLQGAAGTCFVKDLNTEVPLKSSSRPQGMAWRTRK